MKLRKSVILPLPHRQQQKIYWTINEAANQVFKDITGTFPSKYPINPSNVLSPISLSWLRDLHLFILNIKISGLLIIFTSRMREWK